MPTDNRKADNLPPVIPNKNKMLLQKEFGIHARN
jgi:hypothetical protein